MPVLKNQRTDTEWTQWGPEDYHTYSRYGDPDQKPIGLHFKCPGCGEIIGIDGEPDPSQPEGWRGWRIDFATLTATPSIRHLRDGRGCGWHGHLTNGSLDGKIE